jgi:prepilin-type N-terminal cleavage/methylation domain-containing protein
MNGGKNRQPLGYTIVEVMIVLAVSGVIFLIAINFINGKEGRTAFTAGTNQLASTIQNTIEQVTDGQYSDVPFTCQHVDGSPPQITGSAAPHGTNSDCLFIGQLLYFQQGTSTEYDTFPLAGYRLNDSGQPAISSDPTHPFTEALPVPVYGTGGDPDLTVQSAIPQSLTVVDIKVDGSAAYNFGFSQGLGSLNTSDATNSTFATGAQTVSLVYNPDLDVGGLTYQNAITGYLIPNAAALIDASSASICLTNGTQYADVDVGGSDGNQLSVNVTVQPDKAACS